jgi:hypothetical protein
MQRAAVMIVVCGVFAAPLQIIHAADLSRFFESSSQRSATPKVQNERPEHEGNAVDEVDRDDRVAPATEMLSVKAEDAADEESRANTRGRHAGKEHVADAEQSAGEGYVVDEENAVVPLVQWPVPSMSPPRVVFSEQSRAAIDAKPVVLENATPAGKRQHRVTQVPAKRFEVTGVLKVRALR